MIRIALALALIAAPLAAQESPENTDESPRVDVVFALDTTGSMGGLIQGAKEKVWSIVNQIASGNPSPSIRVGLVAYRDKGDEYISRVIPLTSDLDQMFGELMSFSAGGGGDGPEHVNAALSAAIDEMTWDESPRTLRIVFLVGDAPPHLDYEDDIDYPATCEKAVRQGIMINTIRCGANVECARIWNDIANRSEGKFVSIAQDGGVASIPTPHDGELARLDSELSGTFVYYGRDRRGAEDKLSKADAMAESAGAHATASRALYKSREAGREGSSYTEGDLVTESKKEAFDPAEVDRADLSEELGKMNDEQLGEHLTELLTKREDIQKKIREVSEQRDTFLRTELERRGKSGGFDEQVFDILREQAAEKGIDYTKD